jgi:NTP pyrophosphatase (non-canonical NTP hydrolase)
MTQEQINKWVKEAHDNAVERGFYECYSCDGRGSTCLNFERNICDIIDIQKCNQLNQCGEYIETICTNCAATGKDPNKNIGELLMLIVCEIAEAVEAHRNNCYADGDLDDWDFNGQYFSAWYEKHHKNTYTDELADVFIRLFDLCGYLGINKDCIHSKQYSFGDNIAEELLFVTRILSDTDCKSYLELTITEAISRMIHFCQHHNIPIEKHIEAKISYNKLLTKHS